VNPPLITKKALLCSILLSLFIIVAIIVSTIFDSRTKIVFCDVGQGDAAYIRIKNKYDLLVDAGPDRKVLDCLGKYMPFYDRQIEMVIISHWQKDHYGGLLSLLDHYQIGQIVTGKQMDLGKIEKIVKQPIKITFVDNKSRFNLFNDRLSFYWPINNYFVLSTDNSASLVFGFAENKFKVLFTADTPTSVLNYLPKQEISHVSILKIPHHGSKTGLNKTFLKLADPGLSVISVGKNNPYGHPHQEVMDTLKALNNKYWRTDEKGDLVIYVPN